MHADSLELCLCQALWADLCVKDFVKIRIAVEDGTMLQKPKSWRDLHEEETEKQKVSWFGFGGAFSGLNDHALPSDQVGSCS